MALVVRSANASMDSSRAMYLPMLPTLIAGAAIDMASPCYIKASDGKVYMCDGTAADEKAICHGFSPEAKAAGQMITLYGKGAIFHYSDNLLVPGTLYFIAATPGRLDTAATTGDAVGCARAITPYDIRVVRDW